MARGPVSLPIVDGGNVSRNLLGSSDNAALTGNVSLIQALMGADAATLATTSNGVPVAINTGTNVIGHVIVDTTSTTAVTQATAANLNAAVVGVGTAGSASGGVVTVQGVASMTPILATAAGTTASGSAVAANPLTVGGRGATANPTAVADGQVVNAMFDKLGKQVTVGAIRTLKGSQNTIITASTAETTIVTAVASTFLDLYGLILANTGATTTKVDIRDTTGGAIIATIEVPTLETRGFMLPVDSAIPQTTVNTSWTAQGASSTSSLQVTALYVKNI